MQKKLTSLEFEVIIKKCRPLNLSIDNIQVSQASKAKFLGIVIDEHLDWKEHCRCIISQLSSFCYLFRNLRNVLTTEQLVLLYHTQVGSRLRYALIFWGSSIMLKNVLVCQKRVIRCLLGLKRRDSCRTAFKRLNILTVTSLYIYELCIYVFKNRHSFVRNKDFHGLNTRYKNNFHLAFKRLNVTKNCPDHMGLILFNSLPDRIKDSVSLSIFKRVLKDFLLEMTLYNMGEFHARCDRRFDAGYM